MRQIVSTETPQPPNVSQAPCRRTSIRKQNKPYSLFTIQHWTKKNTADLNYLEDKTATWVKPCSRQIKIWSKFRPSKHKTRGNDPNLCHLRGLQQKYLPVERYIFLAKYFQLNNLLCPIYLSFIRKKMKLLVLLNIMKGREENIPVKKNAMMSLKYQRQTSRSGVWLHGGSYQIRE